MNAALTGSITAARAGDWPNMIPVNFYTSYKFDKNSKVQLDIENIFNRQEYNRELDKVLHLLNIILCH